MPYALDVEVIAPFDPAVHGTDRELKLYYDETNNVRKLLLTENGFNVSKYDNFVLGGVVVDEGVDFGDLEDLRGILKIQKSAPEIKFDLVARGEFEKVLDSRKLGDFLYWLISKDIKIHYTNMNILNWCILDIVESIVADESFRKYFSVHRELKNELYRMVARDVPAFLSILKAFNYPDVNRGATSDFLKAVRGFVLKHLPIEHNQVVAMLAELLLEAQSLSELTFIVDETPGQLIRGFQDIFLNRVARFRNSTHVFDEEPTIQKAIEGIRVKDRNKDVAFSFADSKVVPGIQLSDVVVGFLGKYFTFIERTSAGTLIKKKASLTQTQRENLNSFRQLVEKTDKFSNALLHRITTMDSDWKADYFLFGRKLPPHLKGN
ncbi:MULTISPECIES: DUF3800 domain-containing protein [unclassified Pseudomonas]|uniref:DUF3800 domain-containing protein n=1 Tax=unclassified Pseudomonas TaxID=196821 RepID=UPI000871447C|nr:MULTISPECIES: DUF3800 domain-containing protein [unclassified Pseudomonas]SCW96509.1 hypothetical protein SAMN03159481_04231 [Pseudomonas sp. NFACC56-3]SFK69083.1 hypothetical protein SAMN03159473_03375 [Pseudomonas sp. NFACC52]